MAGKAKIENIKYDISSDFQTLCICEKGNSQGEEANVASEISVISAKIGTTEKLRRMKFYYRR